MTQYLGRAFHPLLITALLGLSLLSAPALAQQTGLQEYLNKKQEARQRSSWTLTEWLATKDQMRLMDQWLLMNTDPPSMHEFYVGFEPASYLDGNNLGQERTAQIDFAAYATIAGLAGSYLLDRSGWDGAFRLRLLGGSEQGTNFTVEYGLRHREFQDEALQNQTLAARTTLNLTGAFGLIGSYQAVLPAKAGTGETIQGDITKGGVFFDFHFFRVQGQWFRNSLSVDGIVESSEGVYGSLGFFF